MRGRMVTAVVGAMFGVAAGDFATCCMNLLNPWMFGNTLGPLFPEQSSTVLALAVGAAHGLALGFVLGFLVAGKWPGDSLQQFRRVINLLIYTILLMLAGGLALALVICPLLALPLGRHASLNSTGIAELFRGILGITLAWCTYPAALIAVILCWRMNRN